MDRYVGRYRTEDHKYVISREGSHLLMRLYDPFGELLNEAKRFRSQTASSIFHATIPASNLNRITDRPSPWFEFSKISRPGQPVRIRLFF